MEKDGITVPVARDPKYLMDLAFIVDIRQELNVLYKRLQGQLVSVVCDNARVFSKNLVLWKVQLSQTNLCHFTACKASMQLNGKKCVDTIVKLQNKCDYRFWDFRHRASVVEDVPYASDGANWPAENFCENCPPPSHCRMFKQNMFLFLKYLCTMNFNEHLRDEHLHTESLSYFIPQAKCGSTVYKKVLPSIWQQGVGESKTSQCSEEPFLFCIFWVISKNWEDWISCTLWITFLWNTWCSLVSQTRPSAAPGKLNLRPLNQRVDCILCYCLFKVQAKTYIVLDLLS